MKSKIKEKKKVTKELVIKILAKDLFSKVDGESVIKYEDV